MLTVILTGGGSRRMGRDKAMLPWQGNTMLQSLIDKYSAALGDVAVSVNERGRFPFTGAAEFCDRYPNLGPLNGIVSAFSETDADVIFLTGTDLPHGDPKLVLRLREKMGDADACVMRRGKKGMEPLFALYGRACYAAALECLEEGKQSFFDMLEKLRVRFVQPEELPEFDLEHILMNVNTAEEYESARKE